METEVRELKEDINKLEIKLIENIISCITDLNLDVNIVASKVKSQGKFRKYIESNESLQIRYEIHYLEESIYLDPIDKKILYSNNKIGYNNIEISNNFYIKIRMAIIGRKNYVEMIDKKSKLEKILE